VSVRPRRCKRCRARLEVRETGRPRFYCSAACKQAVHRRRRRRSALETLWSSRSDDWPTDPAYMARLVERFGTFDLDPCATAENAKATRYFTREEDGLAQTWTGRVFVNPPLRQGDRRVAAEGVGVVAVDRRARRLPGARPHGHELVARVGDARLGRVRQGAAAVRERAGLGAVPVRPRGV
jgi:DNA N-6-adenine-methyltransferase (Dam)